MQEALGALRDPHSPCGELNARPRGEIHFTAKTPGEDNRQECSCLCHSRGFVWAPFNEAQQFTTALPLSLERKLCRAASPLPLISLPQELEPHSSTAARAWWGEEGAPSPGLLWGIGTRERGLWQTTKENASQRRKLTRSVTSLWDASVRDGH